MTIRDKSHILQAPVFRRKLSDSPLTLIDVGARDGIHPRWEAFQPNLSVIGFEPDEDECRALNSRSGGASGHEVFIPTALSDKARQAEMYVTRKPACSSFFPP